MSTNRFADEARCKADNHVSMDRKCLVAWEVSPVLEGRSGRARTGVFLCNSGVIGEQNPCPYGGQYLKTTHQPTHHTLAHNSAPQAQSSSPPHTAHHTPHPPQKAPTAPAEVPPPAPVLKAGAVWVMIASNGCAACSPLGRSGGVRASTS